ncbi:hypothetical protein KL953_18025 [Mycolicibacterium goodii]|nr:hypothetical protein [Mycolicibacterium goodii]
MAVVLAIALAVVVTVLVVRPDGGKGTTDASSGPKSEFASADDVGPISIITEDPTCDAWGRIARDYSDTTQTVDWAARDYAVPAASWTPQQRNMYETVGKAMTTAADQTIALVKQTPHRVMRELYEQFIAYARAFESKISAYTSDDDNFAVATDAFMIAAANICSAIDYGSAQTIGPRVPDAPAPTHVSQPLDPAESKTFLNKPNLVCPEWASLVTEYSEKTAKWRALDRSVSAKDWSPEYQTLNNAMAPVMSANADELERLGKQSNNPTLEDIAILAAQYQRGFVIAIPNYTPSDNLLAESATQLMRTVNWACKASAR